MRVTRFLSKVVRVAACLAVLALGATATTAQGKRIVRFEGARPSLEACLSARAAVQTASGLLRAKDPAYRAHLDTAHADVDDALTASVQAVWPTELRRRQRYVGRFLSAAAMRVSLSESPAIVERLGRVARHVRLAQRNLAKAALLLDGVVPTEKPDLSDDPVDPPPVIGPPNEFTWTELSPSADSRVIYVSSSEGDDTNDGLSPEHPKATWWGANGAGTLMRPQFPDWMLLKRGDVWTVTDIHYYLSLQGGRSASEPMVLSSYGNSTTRPKIQNMQVRISPETPVFVEHVAIVGIHMERTVESRANYDTAILITPGQGSDYLIEDCLIEKWALGIAGDPREGYRLANLRIRGCVIADSYCTYAHSQGLLVGGIDGVLVEGCLFDHNGWSATIPGAGSTIFNHNVYIYHTCTDVVFRQNISARSSANGMPAGVARVNEDNLYLSNPFSCVQYNVAPTSVVRHNVFIDGANVRGPNMDDGNGSQGGGIGLNVGFSPDHPTHTVEICDNIWANQVTGTGPSVIVPTGPIAGLSVHDNIAYKWDLFLRPGDNNTSWSGTNDVTNNIAEIGSGPNGLLFYSSVAIDPSLRFAGNQWYSAATTPPWVVGLSYVQSSDAWVSASGETGGTYTQPSFPDPTRSPASYNASLGGASTLEAFLTEARKQSKSNWRPAYTAREANNYFRAGFGRSAR